MRTRLTSISLSLLLWAVSAHGGWDEGVAAFTNKDYAAAATEFQSLVEQHPDESQGHYMLGLAFEQLQRKEEALHHLRKAYDLNPNDLSIKVDLGRAYYNVRRYSESSELLETVDPSVLPEDKRAAFYQFRGLSRLELDRDDAEEDIAAAAELAPDDADLARRHVSALIRRARNADSDEAGKPVFELAARLASELVAADARFPNLMLKISAELGAGLNAQAVETGRMAVSSHGDNWQAHYYLGQAYSSNKQYKASETSLEEAISAAADAGDLKRAWRQLGFVYEKQKKYTQAAEAYENAGDDESVDRVRGSGDGGEGE